MDGDAFMIASAAEAPANPLVGIALGVASAGQFLVRPSDWQGRWIHHVYEALYAQCIFDLCCTGRFLIASNSSIAWSGVAVLHGVCDSVAQAHVPLDMPQDPCVFDSHPSTGQIVPWMLSHTVRVK